MISRCSEARDWTTNRSEWSSETTTDATTAGYRRTPTTSIDATRTEFSVGTAASLGRSSRTSAGLCSARLAGCGGHLFCKE
jgi:hypothetical protein